jgi:hypothetical protein
MRGLHQESGAPVCDFGFDFYATAADPFWGLAAGNAAPTGGEPFSTLSIKILHCRPLSRTPSTSSPSSAPRTAFPRAGDRLLAAALREQSLRLRGFGVDFGRRMTFALPHDGVSSDVVVE